MVDAAVTLKIPLTLEMYVLPESHPTVLFG